MNFFYNSAKYVSSVPLDNAPWNFQLAEITLKSKSESLAQLLSIKLLCWFLHERTQEPTWKNPSCIKA